jgi:hypothetical protein
VRTATTTETLAPYRPMKRASGQVEEAPRTRRPLAPVSRPAWRARRCRWRPSSTARPRAHDAELVEAAEARHHRARRRPPTRRSRRPACPPGPRERRASESPGSSPRARCSS